VRHKVQKCSEQQANRCNSSPCADHGGSYGKSGALRIRLKFLNLQQRLQGQGLEVLRQFYAAHKEIDEAETGKPPSWWDSLEWFYAK